MTPTAEPAGSVGIFQAWSTVADRVASCTWSGVRGRAETLAQLERAREIRSYIDGPWRDTFAGIAPASVPGFAAAQLVGAVVAAALIVVFYPHPGVTAGDDDVAVADQAIDEDPG